MLEATYSLSKYTDGNGNLGIKSLNSEQNLRVVLFYLVKMAPDSVFDIFSNAYLWNVPTAFNITIRQLWQTLAGVRIGCITVSVTEILTLVWPGILSII